MPTRRPRVRPATHQSESFPVIVVCKGTSDRPFFTAAGYKLLETLGDPDTEERLMEMFRRWKRRELPDLEEEPENQTEHR